MSAEEGSTRRTRRFVYKELVTKQVNVAIQFYTSLFGWDVREINYGELKYHRIYLSKDSDVVVGGIVQHSENFPAPEGWLSYLSVDNISESIKIVEAEGGKILKDIAEAGPFGKIAIVTDATGAVFALVELSEKTPVPPTIAPEFTFCWAQLVSSDAEKSFQFYEKLVNWTPFDHNQGENILLRSSETTFEGSVLRGGLNIGDKDAWMSYVNVKFGTLRPITDRAEELGAKVLAPPTLLEGIGSFSALLDPTGSVFALWLYGGVEEPEAKTHRISVVSLLVKDQNEARDWFEEKLGFKVALDLTSESEGRWLTIRPPGDRFLQVSLLQAKEEQDVARVGSQAGSFPVFVYVVEDCKAQVEKLRGKNVEITKEPEKKPYGVEALFKDLYGNIWSLLQVQH